MSFKVVNHYPAINQDNIPRNAIVRVVCSEPVLQPSVNGTTVSIIDSENFISVPSSYSFEVDSDGKSRTIIITPMVRFAPNLRYTVIIYGGPRGLLNQSNVNLSSNYSFEFTTNNTTLDDVNSSGVILNLTKTIYNEEDHELVLSFNLPITESTINTSGDIWLSTTGGGTGYTQLLTVPLTCSLDTDKDDVTITLVSGDYSVIEGWNLVEEDLQIKLSANIFCGQGRWNSLIDYTNVTYTASGEYLPVAHETFIVPSGYTRFQVLETYPKNQQPNVSGVSRITMTFTGLLNRTCHLYDWITVEDNPVL